MNCQRTDPRQRRPDTALAAKELDWQARTSLDQGLPRTIEYFDEYLKEHRPDIKKQIAI